MKTKTRGCLAAENIKQEGMAKIYRLVNRTSASVFYWLHTHGQGTAWMDVYHWNRKGSRIVSMESVWGAWWSPRLTWKRKADWGFRLCRNGELTLIHDLFLKVAHHCAEVWECCLLGPSRGLPHSRASQIINNQVNKFWYTPCFY